MSILDDVALDDHGFMRDPHQWSVDIAEAIAESLGLEGLGLPRVIVIEHLRKHYFADGGVPPEESVCHAMGLEDHCVRDLFGSYLNAWKVAGLPDPGMQLREFMEGAG